ncbi:MAG TPA: hypothetical protein VN519_10325 [Bryobacteraceae bacterium]|nr:hypothetical protein [Bryobacteraceae bacterium]
MIDVSERTTSSVRQVCIAKAGSAFAAGKPARQKTPPLEAITTNLIESPKRGLACRTADVKYWRDRAWSSVGLPRAGYPPETLSGKSPAILILWAMATILRRKTATEISQEKVA